MACLAFLWLAMHVVPTVAVDAGHPSLPEVDIPSEVFVFTQVFIANPAAVTGGTVPGHRRCFIEVVTIDETTADRSGLANVTFAASSMAASTMIAKHLADSLVPFGRRPRVQYGPIPFQVRVQAFITHSHYVRMAFAAGGIWVAARIRHQV